MGRRFPERPEPEFAIGGAHDGMVIAAGNIADVVQAMYRVESDMLAPEPKRSVRPNGKGVAGAGRDSRRTFEYPAPSIGLVADTVMP